MNDADREIGEAMIRLYKERVKSDWVMMMLFSDNHEYRDAQIASMISYVRKTLTPENFGGKSMPMPVAEILDVLEDSTGRRLKKIHDQIAGASSNNNQAKKREQEMSKELLSLMADFEKALKITLEYRDPREEKLASALEEIENLSIGIEKVLSDRSSISVTAEFVEEDVLSGAAMERAVMYKRIIFLIMMCLHARTKGIISMSENGAVCDCSVIVKDMRDLFVLFAPLLWIDFLRWIENPKDRNPAYFKLEHGRTHALCFYKIECALYLEQFLDIKVVMSDHIECTRAKRPIDSILETLRHHYDRWNHEQHIDNKKKNIQKHQQQQQHHRHHHRRSNPAARNHKF